MGRDARTRKRSSTTVANSSGWPCPDFELGELRALPRQIFALQGSDELGAFALSLSLAFNDLKGIEWAIKQLDRCTPPKAGAIDAAVGQWNGMKVQMARWIIGLTHEALRAIGAASFGKLLKVGEGRLVVKEFNESQRAVWVRVVKASRGYADDRTLRKYLAQTRNTAAFHYNYTDELLQGYQKAFAEPLTDRNAHALASSGESMKLTRYYFADAAVQRLYAGDAPLNLLFERSTALYSTLVPALQLFVETFLLVRSR